MSNKFNKTIGQKLRVVREQLGFTLESVAEQMGFNNYQTLSSIEDGSRKLEVSEFIKLAGIYMRDLSYFLSSEKAEKEQSIILWRKQPDVAIKNLREQEFLKYCRNYCDLEKRLNLSCQSALNLLTKNYQERFNYQKIEEIANQYANMMQLGARPACVLEKILDEKFNIKVLYLNLEHAGSAASAVGDFGTAILINSSEPPWRRNYNLAHELFHIITWDYFNYKEIHQSLSVEKPTWEKYADAFAANLLLPADEVRNEFNKRRKEDKISVLDIIGFAREFIVSTVALVWRMVELGIFSKKTAKELIDSREIKEIDKMERRADWNKYLPQDISTRYVNLAIKAFQKGLISKGKLAEYLNVGIADVEAKLLGYGYKVDAVYNKEILIA
jgi:Zn-dependent peptidase ImmA (M78 family)/DNA-binding XRE family transcriptional regulator